MKNMNDLQQLLKDLKSPNSSTRDHATWELWEMWYREAGGEAEEEINHGSQLMGENQMDAAEQVFNHLIKNFPDFAEAHNKLATLLFLLGRYDESVFECERTLKLNPHHFGALHGMGICLYKLSRYDEALKVFERTLKIQPYADANRGYIARCRGKLN